MRYISNPLDGALPAGIGQRIASGKRVSDDSGVRQLTKTDPDQDANGQPAWSPDGNQIAFSSNRDGDYELYVMNVDGSGVHQLTDHSSWDRQPAWSPDGNQIAFSSNRDGDYELYVMNADGSGVHQLTDHRSSDQQPAWSPDGNQIAFSSNRDGDYELYVMNADGSGVHQLTDHRSSDQQPAWSPDGNQIAFSSNRDGDYELYVINADGSNVRRHDRQLTYFSSRTDRTPTWSPNGGQIAFSSGSNGIYVMNVDGSNVRRLTEGVQPAWSPDGGQIAFSSDRDGNLEIYVTTASPPPEPDPHSLTKISGDGQEGLTGAQLDAPFMVSVLNQDGSPVVGAVVSFSVTAGGGTLSTTTAPTDANGQARSTLTLGSDPGTNTVTATVAGLGTVTFTAIGQTPTSEQAIPETLTKVSGDGQEGQAGERLAKPFVVSVLDQNGSAFAGAVVAFSVTAGGGTLSATTVTTDAMAKPEAH